MHLAKAQTAAGLPRLAAARIADPHYTLYIFEEKTLEGIAGELRRLTGRSCLKHLASL